MHHHDRPFLNKPRIFISAVSSEFKSTRQRVSNTLARLGYEPVQQDILGTEHGDLTWVLKRCLDSCQGVIQIVGDAYGAEPPQSDSGAHVGLSGKDFGRVSYTQFEFLYAHARQKRTWLILAGEMCTRDTPRDLLDLPADSNHPDPRAFQAARRKLQSDYIKRPEVGGGGHLRHHPKTDEELDLAVEKLRDELAELRRISWFVLGLFGLALISIIGLLIAIRNDQRYANKEFFSFTEKESISNAAERSGQSTEELFQLLSDRYAEARMLLDRAADNSVDGVEFSNFRKKFEKFLQAAEEAIRQKNAIRLHDTTKKLVLLLGEDETRRVVPPDILNSLFHALGEG